MSANTFDPTRSDACTPSRAARELGLQRDEFDLAIQLGHVRTLPDDGGGGGRLVERAELDRLRAQEGFPDTFSDRVRTVGTADGAALMDVPAGRFTRLARLGLLVPVGFYVNRYRTVVWLYLAEELKRFAAAAENAHLLKGRTPETLRSQLTDGVDLRARNWRTRRLGCLLRQADNPWARAGAVAALLPPVEVADIVKDPYERARVNRCRPELPELAPPGASSGHLAERITTAQDADEIEWLRSELATYVAEARGLSPATRTALRRPRPSRRPTARPIPPMARTITGAVRTPGGAAGPPDWGAELRRAAAAHVSEWPRTSPALPALPPTLRNHGTGPTVPRSTWRLRAWLRRRSPRPAEV
ncbi:DUF6397 family protein [Streptomyces sp. F-1]|uniref:DUF6397 family protein n=1 Tax=Streptomyces sp. F-1 TaxID=463642 RepID=UPI00086EEB60|nr:DUF6397 family protein [Streptomyces sp. F-1]SFY47798.1 hypothetical protein STEPF1_01010 [Streptomyces sp. F-1]